MSKNTEGATTIDKLANNSVVTTSRFNRFDQDLIDRYFTEDGKKAIDQYVSSKVIDARLGIIDRLYDDSEIDKDTKRMYKAQIIDAQLTRKEK